MRRVAWILGACAWMGCAETSTSNYGVAAGFAAAAAAVQVAELAGNDRQALSCNPHTCGGCCNVADQCVEGTEDNACGAGGAVCRDCVVNGHQICGEGACSPGFGGTSQSTSALQGSSAPPVPTASQPCGQVLVFCFPGTYSLCVTDATGCPRCSCTADKRLNGTSTQ